MNKIQVKTKQDDKNGKFKAGETGYIDGYVKGDNFTCFAIVIIENKFVLVNINNVEPIQEVK